MTSMNNKRWARETDARLIELWDQGLSIDGISEQIERTTSAVQSRASKLRLRRQPGDRSRFAPVTADGKVYWTPADDAQLRTFMTARCGLEEVARRLGRTVSAVETRWKRLSRPPSPRIQAAVGAKVRNCMCCKTPFKSSWAGNRLCLPCGTYAKGTRAQYD